MAKPSPPYLSRLRESLEGVAEVIQYRADGWLNAITGLGGSRDRTMGNAMRAPAKLTAEYLENLYDGDDLAATMCDALVETAFLKGFTIAEDQDQEIAKALSRWQVQEKVSKGAVWGRVFGGGALLLGVDVGRMDQPLDYSTVRRGSLKYLLPLDARDLHEDSHNAETLEPELYRVTPLRGGEGRGSLVHASRLVIFPGVRTSERQRIRNGGWDHSVLQRPHEILRDANTNWRSMIALLSDGSQAVMKIEGLIDMIAEGRADVMQNRMEVMNVGRSLAKSILLDAEHESFEQVGAANLAGVAPVMQITWDRLAAAARMPVTVLMGKSPNGLNATGESDLELWHGQVTAYQERVLTPALEIVAEVVARSEGFSTQTSVEFEPLVQESPQSQAAARKTVAETDVLYINAGVVLPEEVTQARWGAGVYSPHMAQAIDVDARDNALKAELEAIINGEDKTPEPPPETPAPALGEGLLPGADPNQPPDQPGDS